MIYLAVVLTVLQLFDGWTTYQVIKAHGREVNPVIQWLIERLGVYQGLLVAKGSAVALVWVLVFLPTVDSLTFTLQGLVLLALGGFYGWVSFNNWKVLQKLRG